VVAVADCLPILAHDPKKQIVGLAHAGWRGTLAGISKNLVQEFISLGSEPRTILIGFGPCIEPCHYEIQEDVAAKFKEKDMSKCLIYASSGKIYLDLRQANKEQLIGLGVSERNIDMNPGFCTFESQDFYSWRREKPNLSGEMACVIGLKDET
jgi:YfiH family protein